MTPNPVGIRIVAGIDLEHYPKALHLLSALRLTPSAVHLLNVVESLTPDGSFPELRADHPLALMLAQRERDGIAELGRAAGLVDPSLHVEKHQDHGDAARLLVEMAHRVGADLVVAGSGQRGKWGSLFFGSVTKALTSEARQSVLIGKQDVDPAAPITAVIATDHSAYADDCMERLLAWAPRGIARATVVTAVTHVEASDPDMLCAKSMALSERLQAIGIDCDSVVEPGTPPELIDQMMQERGANLLIMGARGHGFWQRVWLGSVAHHQVVATPHNVLVLRA